MQFKISSKLVRAVIGVVVTTFFLIVIFFLATADTPYMSPVFVDDKLDEGIQNIIPVIPVDQVKPLVQLVSVGFPLRLKIPAINVDAEIEYVGLDPDGSMGVPKGPAEVAWYSAGSRPGEIGSAIIAGHYGWKNNMPAVFDNLFKLRKGDKIYIEDDRGVIIPFVVNESILYDQNADVVDVFRSRDGRSHLNLITCEGVWDKVSKTYSRRLVVFADRE